MSILRKIDLSDITTNQYQPRSEFSDEAINQLAESIKENGLLQPITVRETYTGYELIAGERRFRACQKLGMQKIEALIIQATEVQTATLAMIENIQREDLSPIEEANGYQQMIRLTGMTQAQLAEKVGKTQSSVANKLRLLNLHSEVIEAINAKEITERHGRALLNLNLSQQKQVLDHIRKKDWNVKQTEQFVQTHFEVEPKRKIKSRCFGVSVRLVINSIRETFEKAKKLNSSISLHEQETDDSYIMTITIKK